MLAYFPVHDVILGTSFSVKIRNERNAESPAVKIRYGCATNDPGTPIMRVCSCPMQPLGRQ